ncbi:MAG: hypothetical protein HDR41_05275 [Lactobacillus sp.]|nr:hypothetical protein [Lactobacillus sp.]
MATPKRLEIIKKSMTDKKTKRFTIVDYCKNANVSRTAFYNFYGNGVINLYSSVFEEQINKSLTFRTQGSFAKTIDDALEEIFENREVYLLMYEGMNYKERKAVRERIVKALFEKLKDYSFLHEGISATRLKVIANGIYGHIFNWVLHSCEDDKREVYKIIHDYSYDLEGYCRTCKKKVR